MRRGAFMALAAITAATCGHRDRSRARVEEPTPTPARPAEAAPRSHAPPAAGPVEVFPGVRVDAAAHTVEFDGIVPLDAHDPITPVVYLEMFVCSPDTHEHESLVMSGARASHIHAALLLAGFTPGHPGRVDETGRGREIVPPEGDRLDVRLLWTDATGRRECRASEWIVHESSGERLSDRPNAGWIFAGSRIATRMGREVYDADGTGHIVSLATWGDDTVAWSDAFSPWEAIDLPIWIADAHRVPKFGTPVTVRITRP